MHIPTQSDIDAARQSGINSVGAAGASLPTTSLQLMFAKLQLTLSDAAKQSAMGYINDIEKTQEEQKKVADMLQQARQLQADAKSQGDTACTTMPADMKKYMVDNDLAYDKTGNDDLHNKDEWEVAIASLKARSESLGTDTQQKMVFVQDFMGQYNSYLQGANTAIQQSNQTLGELARVR
jgi:hypothetical protein